MTLDDRLSPAEFRAVLHEVSSRYSRGSRFTRRYIASKLRTDPVNRMVLERAVADGFGHVLDIGCGRGQLALALLEGGGARSVLGLDWSAAALAEAQRAARGLAFRTDHRNLAEPDPLPAADTVLMVDVLYQLPTPVQDSLLRRACAAARRRVLIRTLDPNRGLRSRFAITMERLARRAWPNSGAVVNPRPVRHLQAALEAQGFEVSVEPCWQGTPFANVLLDARRPAARVTEAPRRPPPAPARP